MNAGEVLARLLYADLNPSCAGLREVPSDSLFCEDRHGLAVDSRAEDAALTQCMAPLDGRPLFDAESQEKPGHGTRRRWEN